MHSTPTISRMKFNNSLSEKPGKNPFDINDDVEYGRWKKSKIAGYPSETQQLIVPVRHPGQLSVQELSSIRQMCRKTNMAIYQLDPSTDYSKQDIAGLARQLGLTHLDNNLLADEDSITTLQFNPAKNKRGYIPYSNRRINWHTDGYYNAPDKMIRAMLLHCEQPAANGGENSLLDHEMVYMMLRDANPDYVRLLMQPNAMTIPANTEPGVPVRDVSTGPVFSVSPRGNLHMRYTARSRSIKWKPNASKAVEALSCLMNDHSPWKFRVKLRKGQGLICNNVLHTRTDFDRKSDQSPRLLYRARYHNRIEGTDIDPI